VTSDPVDEKYVALVTFRRTGAAVSTPVWIAKTDSACYVFSEGRAGKVKRIRNNPAVRLAACDFRGRVHGPWHSGRACVVSDLRTIEKAYRAFRQKYGWSMKIGDFFSRLSGRYGRRAMLEIELDEDA